MVPALGESMSNADEPLGGDFLYEPSESYSDGLVCGVPGSPMSVDQVRAYREQFGLSVEEFAAQFGFKPETVARFESSL